MASKCQNQTKAKFIGRTNPGAFGMRRLLNSVQSVTVLCVMHFLNFQSLMRCCIWI